MNAKCFQCGALQWIKWGQTRTGCQRFRCKSCGKTASDEETAKREPLNRKRELLVWPFGSDDPLLVRIAKLLPKNLPDDVRAEAGQTLALWVLEGTIDRPEGHVRDARREANRATETRRAVSITSYVAPDLELRDCIEDDGTTFGHCPGWAIAKAVRSSFSSFGQHLRGGR